MTSKKITVWKWQKYISLTQTQYDVLLKISFSSQRMNGREIVTVYSVDNDGGFESLRSSNVQITALYQFGYKGGRNLAEINLLTVFFTTNTSYRSQTTVIISSYNQTKLKIYNRNEDSI
jgi:hypothetical protein